MPYLCPPLLWLISQLRPLTATLFTMVARQLIFYKWSNVSGKPAFEYHHALAELRDKIAGDPQFAVMQNNEVTTAVDVATPGTETLPAHLQLLALRDEDNRPSQWKPGGQLSALSMPADSYPSDVSHVVIWPDGIAAQDLHANAPRLGRLSFYLRHQVHANVTFEPLYHPDMLVRLQQLRGRLRGVEISLTRPEYVEPNKGAFSTLVPAIWGPRVPSLAVHIGMGRRGPRDRFLDEAAEEDIFRIAEDAHDTVDRLVVIGKNPTTNKTERVNLLSERLQERAEISARTDAPGLPEADLVYQALETAYRAFRGQGLFDRAIQAQATRPR
jgi:hypothetical protein